MSTKLLTEDKDEGGRQLPADPDLAPGAPPQLDLPPKQLVQTPAVPPPVPLAAGTFTVGRTSQLSPLYSVSEPAVGSQGNGIFTTNNWGAARSTDNGANWTYMDPFSTFPNSPTGFTAGVCCDQRVIQDPARDLIIWFLQYSQDGTGKNGLRIAVTNGQAGLAVNAWTYHDITPADFGLSAQWLDFPTLQVSSNYLYVTTNIFNTNNTFYGAAIARIPLANLANNTAYTMNTFVTTSFGSITGVNGAGTTMYFGSRFGSNSIKVLTWPEANASPTETTVSGLSTIAFAAFVCTTPDGLNPCGRADTRMQTGWVTATELGFMWASAQDGTHPYPWIKAAILAPATLAVISQPDIFSSDSAWLYPALAVNARGHIAGVVDRMGGNVATGGSDLYPQVRAIIRDDFSPDVTVSGWETYALSTSTNGTDKRWGDYNGATAHENFPNTWLGVGHIQQGGSGDTNTGQTHAKVMNYAFYRQRDDPNGLPTISINDVSVAEGNSGTSLATFTVSLSAPAVSTVGVNWATADGTATTAGGDYVANAGSLSFTAGQQTKQVSVIINGDQLFEPNETFFVNLSAPTNAAIADGQGQGTITNDDTQMPIVTTGAVSGIPTDSTANLNGTINPNGLATNGSFQYGTTIAYGTTSANMNVGPGITSVPLPIPIDGLACNTTYHFRAVGTNSAGTRVGADNTFSTSVFCPPPPTVTTSAATNFTQTGATLNGTINPNNGVTNRRFEYGLTAAYGSTSPNLSMVPGNAGLPVSYVVTGLACNTLYHYRAVGQNGGGVTNGGDVTFTTAACPPAGSNNISALTAQAIPVNSMSQDSMSNVRAETWYRVRLFASRSYQISAWPVDHEQGADAPALDFSLFSDDAGTSPASPAPTLSSTELEGSPNSNGDLLPASLVFQPSATGVYKIRILRASGGTVTHSINVAVRETTIFSPWTSKAAGFEGFVEMHNNTNAALSVTLRAYDSTGTLQGAGLTITLQPNATDFRTATQIGVPVNVFAGIVLTHNGALGAISANITTLNGANGLSFDSPFTPRSPAPQSSPVR